MCVFVYVFACLCVFACVCVCLCVCMYVCVCVRECESYTDQLYVVAERAGVVHSVALTTHQLQEMVEARLKILTVSVLR